MKLTPLFLIAGAAYASPECRPFPGDASWPSPAQWTALNTTLSGRLIQPLVAPGGVCHPDQANYDAGACEAMTSGQWDSYAWNADDAVSVMWENWANWTCVPEPDMPCSLGGYPSYVVNATTTGDVQAAVNFGRPPGVFMCMG